MKKGFQIVLLFLAFSAWGQFNPQPKKMTAKFFPEKEDLPNVTPALQKKDGFTNYEELTNFLTNLCNQHPEKAQLEYIGETKRGLKIPLIRVGEKTNGQKIKVWMQGGLHGDEPASTEALLYLLHELLNSSQNAALLKSIDLAIVPMANIDGYLKQERNNAEDLDLNRDQTKLMAVETPFLKQAFSNFRPDIALDFHEYRPFRRDFAKMSDFGVSGYYDVMFLYSGNLNVREPLRNFTQEVFLNPTRQVLDANQLTHHDYVTTVEHFGETQFNRGSENARSSATNFALQNTISTLVEVRGVGIGRTSFKRRIFTGYLVAKSYLDIASSKADEIQRILSIGQVTDQPLVVASAKKVYKGSLDFIDLDKTERIQLNVVFRDALQSSAKLIRPRPKGYFLLAGQEELIRKIELFGIKVEKLSEPRPVKVEQYTVTGYKREAEKTEKMNLQEVETSLKIVETTFPVGTYYVSMEQAMSPILPELLEPEAPNSFISFGVLPTASGEILPIYRLIHD